MNFASSSSSQSRSINGFTPSRHATSLSIDHGKAKFRSLAIEGEMKEGNDFVQLGFFAKVAVEVNAPQQSFVLFPESNAQLIGAAVHPLDGKKPYAWPTSIPPLLRRAFQVLDLETPHDYTYIEALAEAKGMPVGALLSPASNNSSLAQNPEAAVYGDIKVQNFNFTLVTPKHLMPDKSPFLDGAESARLSDSKRFGSPRSSEAAASQSTYSTPRRGQLPGKIQSNYIIALEVKVPFSGLPPDSPFMVQIPLPDCIDNRIRLKMPPVPSKYRRDGLEDRNWSIFSRPRVSQPKGPFRWERRMTIPENAEFADDEDEDNPLDDGYNVHCGTFQSERSNALVVRWCIEEPTAREEVIRARLRSVKGLAQALGTHKLARVDRAESSLKYSVHPVEDVEVRQEDGDNTVRVQRRVPIDVEWDVRCTGFKSSGIETGLAVEVNFDAKDRGVELDWANPPGHIRSATGSAAKVASWAITGATGALGFTDSVTVLPEEPPLAPTRLHREDSASPTPSPVVQPHSLIRSINKRDPHRSEALSNHPAGSHARSLSASMTASGSVLSSTQSSLSESHLDSLMRAPLPRPSSPDVQEYSFEDPDGGGDTDDEGEYPHRGHHSSRGSSGPSAVSVVSANSSTIDRLTSQATNASEDGIGSGVSSASLPTPTSFSGVTDMSSSPFRPRSRSMARPVSSPSDPVVVRCNLLAILTSQRVPNPAQAELQFLVKGRIHMLLPDDVAGDSITLPLPKFRVPHASQHYCCVQLEAVSSGRTEGPHHSLKVCYPGAKPLSVTQSQGAIFQTIRILPAFTGDSVSSDEVTLTFGNLGIIGASLTRDSPTKQLLLTTHARPENGLGPQYLSPPPDSAVDLVMPSPLASEGRSTSTAVGTPVQPTYRRSEVSGSAKAGRASTPRLDIKIIPDYPVQRSQSLPPMKLRGYVTRLTMPWPTYPGNRQIVPNVGLGFPLGSEGNVNIRSAHIGRLQACVKIWREEESYQQRRRLTTGFENPSEATFSGTNWLCWIQIDLPEGFGGNEGDLEVVYDVQNEEKARSKDLIAVVVPGFNMAIGHLRLDVEVPSRYGFKLVSTDLEVGAKAIASFEDLTVPPLAPRALSFKLSKRWPLAKLGYSPAAAVQVLQPVVIAVIFLLLWSELAQLRTELDLPPGPLRSRLSTLSEKLHLHRRRGFVDGTEAHVHRDQDSTATGPKMASSAVRRPPKETYVPPPDLWGDWEEWSSTDAKPRENLADGGQRGAKDPPSGAVTSTYRIADVYTAFSGALGYAKGEHRARALYLFKGFLRRALILLQAAWDWPN